jgi:predicted transcriptional regulator of viral defense system
MVLYTKVDVMAGIQSAQEIFAKHGVLRTSQATELGIAPPTLYRMRDLGIIDEVARGIYRLAEHPEPGNSDFVTVALRYPQAVIALISALSYHGLTIQIPHSVYVALPQGTKHPKSTYPPLEVVRLSQTAYEAGIETITIGAVKVKIYGQEKTVCDCFKFRNKYGEDVALEALRSYLGRPSAEWDLQKLLHFAKLDQVERLITPYLKALL